MCSPFLLSGADWQASTPRPIVPRNVLADVSISLRTFDVTLDGQRFLVLKGSSGARMPAPQIVVVQDWLGEIRPSGPKTMIVQIQMGFAGN